MEAATRLIGSLIRHGLTFLGGAGFVVAEDVVTQLASGVVTVAVTIYSVYRSIKANRKAEAEG